MKDIVGTIKIYRDSQKKSLRVYLCKNLNKLIGTEVVFNLKKLSIKRPTLDSERVYSAKNKVFTCTPRDEDIDDYIGVYDVFQKDEDHFKLRRCQVMI
jgi:hypothetical protein